MFFCKECGGEVAKWSGKCPVCGAWNSLKEVKEVFDKKNKHITLPKDNASPMPISEIDDTKLSRISSGISEFDVTLGGGIISGMVVLIGGEPGIGKSTLLLQLSENLSKTLKKVLYVSGEESLQQIKTRSSRLGVNSQNLYLYCNTNVEEIIKTIESTSPDLVIIDSIQSVYLSSIDNVPGSITQLRESTAIFTRLAKQKNIPFFLVGHVTKDGIVAGPKIIEHMVDTVLYFEGDKNNQFKILRSTKNRFGSTNEIGIFEMQYNGLNEVKNPSQLFLYSNSLTAGTSVGCMLEGTRAFLVEVQALTTPANYGTPQRVALGIDQKKLSLLIAVLEKNVGINLKQSDVFLNITGGVKVVEPSLDLAIIASIISSFRNITLLPNSVFIGEVGLSGEVRPVSQTEKRVKEAAKLGYRNIFISDRTKISNKNRVIKIKGIADILPHLFVKKYK